MAAAALSAVVPGLGQLLSRRWARAATLIGLSAALGLLGWWYVPDAATWLTWVVDAQARPWLHVANAALLLLRLGAAVDAYLLAARPPAIPVLPRTVSAMVATAIGMGVLLAGTIVPHAALGYTAERAAAVLDQVLVADGDLDAGDGPDAGPGPDPVEPTPPHRAPVTALPDAPDNPWQDRERVTVAVLGSDAGPGRVGSRLDALLVASLDTRTGVVVLFSLDRYLADFPLPDHLDELYHERCTTGEGWRYLNALYTCGLERISTELAELYPASTDPAAAAVTDTLAELIDIRIDHHVLVDMAGFVALLDALGGVELELASPLTVRMSPAAEGGSWRTFALPAGRQLLDGEEALAYARVRGSGGDSRRMERQRCLVASAVTSADLPSLLRGFPAVATAMEQHVTTDIATAELPQLVRLLLGVDLGPVVAEGFGPPTYRGADHRPEVDAIRQRAAELLDGEVGLEPVVPSGGDLVCP